MAMYAFLKNPRIRFAVGVILGICAIFIFYYFREIFIPLFIGILLAYMLNPVVNWLQSKGVNRKLGVSFLFVILFSIVIFIIVAGVPALFNQANGLILAIIGDEYADVNGDGVFDEGDQLLKDRNNDGKYSKPLLMSFEEWVIKSTSGMAGRIGKEREVRLWITEISKWFKKQTGELFDNIKADPGNYLKKIFSNTYALIAYSIGLLFIPVYTFLMLLEMREIKKRIIPLLPGRSRDDIMRIVKKIDLAVSAFFRGRVIVCSICGLVTWIGLWIIGVKYSFLFGFLIGTATVVPFLGLVFLAPTLLIAYMGPGGSVSAVVWATLLYFAVQGLQALLDPVILGKEVALHPVFLILAFLICGKILGFIGVLIAVPIASIIKILIEEFVMPSVQEMAAEHDTGSTGREEALEKAGDEPGA